MEGYCNGRPGDVGSVESEGEGEAGAGVLVKFT